MNLYVGNLSRAVTEMDLQVLFEGLGDIVYAKFVGMDDDQRARGYAFVRVENALQAETAVAALHGKFLKGLMLVVSVEQDEALERSILRRNLRDQAGIIPVGERRPDAAHVHLHGTTGFHLRN